METDWWAPRLFFQSRGTVAIFLLALIVVMSVRAVFWPEPPKKKRGPKRRRPRRSKRK